MLRRGQCSKTKHNQVGVNTDMQIQQWRCVRCLTCQIYGQIKGHFCPQKNQLSMLFQSICICLLHLKRPHFVDTLNRLIVPGTHVLQKESLNSEDRLFWKLLAYSFFQMCLLNSYPCPYDSLTNIDVQPRLHTWAYIHINSQWSNYFVFFFFFMKTQFL